MQQTKLFFLFFMSASLDCTVVKNKGSNDLIGEKDRDVTMVWMLQDVFKDTVLKVYYNIQSDDNLAATLSYTSDAMRDISMNTEVIPDKFRDKLKGKCSIVNGNGRCEVTISKLQYNHNGSLMLINLDRHEIYGKDKFNLDVKGGPEHCGDQQFAPNTTVFLGGVITGNISLCGKPQPKLQWYLGDEKINGTLDLSKKDKHRYSYSFKLLATKYLTGSNISYHAVGYNQQEVRGQTNILVMMPLVGEGAETSLTFGAIIGIVLSIIIVMGIVVIGVLYYRGTIGNRKHEGVVLNGERMSMNPCEEHV